MMHDARQLALVTAVVAQLHGTALLCALVAQQRWHDAARVGRLLKHHAEQFNTATIEGSWRLIDEVEDLYAEAFPDPTPRTGQGEDL